VVDLAIGTNIRMCAIGVLHDSVEAAEVAAGRLSGNQTLPLDGRAAIPPIYSPTLAERPDASAVTGELLERNLARLRIERDG
jgi:hypothetical protein